ncbi:uncharacterized protein I206_102823 [Kwoniella pini CBS 10737]|uniref:2',3'-cyclic-nucleotide 3'-phosphodiesterase n=1 Tax=Kwoniella pini CBS 10737 TaxID=1296096 RepID=A0A1B9I6J6_9TREE|nr:uncharacterized protein I206_03177 [Kwoniella pini CBS 10737]OCF51111.1 hypothetical protein I206_03177 [Kwoniella pini CBS 10737]
MTDATKDPAAPQLAAYALWLVPTIQEQKDQFQNLIKELASFEEPSPIFQPHITLLHPIPLSTKLNEIHLKLKESIKSISSKYSLNEFEVKLNKAQKGEKYYQSVLSPVIPSNTLLELRKEIENQFNLKNLPNYFPHLSLFYGGIKSNRRDELAEIANNRIKEFGNLQVGEIVIVSCIGTAENWEIVGKEKLF